jgi:three-Cys-motif partner protein
LYIDTHAGRGTHLTGDLGSPLVALHTLLEHSSLDTLLAASEFRFTFIERDEENCAALQKDLKQITLPARIHVAAVAGNSFENLERLVTGIAARGQRLAPAFIFVDPYGFKVPGRLLRQLFDAGRTELFINVIWRELDMALTHGRNDRPGFVETLNEIFDGDRWRAITGEHSDERAEKAAQALAEMVGARWSTHIRMLGDNRATRYLLLHLSKHEAGRDLMKDCMWAICPDGGFYARKTNNQAQQVLIEPEPDLAPLRRWVLDQLDDEPKRWSALEAGVRDLMWRIPHLNTVVRTLRNEEIIDATEYQGAFSRRADWLLTLRETQE